MKYLKKFEHFTGHDLGRFSEEEENKDFMTNPDENQQAFDQEEEEIFSIIRLIFWNKDTIQPQYSFPYNTS